MIEYTHLSLEERGQIYVGIQNGKNVRQVARELNRHFSSVYREIKRNKTSNELGYLPDTADIKAKTRKDKRQTKLEKYPGVKRFIIEKLENKWSPEQIAGRMILEKRKCKVSCETIYSFIYSKEGIKLGLPRMLPRKRPQREKRSGRKINKSIIPNRVSIHDRPESINNRSEFGHLEIDLTFNKGNQSTNICTIVERKSRYTRLILLSSKKTETVIGAIYNRLSVLPKHTHKSATFDNGLEFAQHGRLKDLSIKTYFCDKHSPWQKGLVEQTHVMLHHLLSKDTNLNTITREQINNIEQDLR